MKRNRRPICLTALLLCLALLLPACASAGTPGHDTPAPESSTEITLEDLRGALIVYPENADASLADAAKALQTAISEKCGIRVNTMVDYFKAFNPEKSVKEVEILIGCTNRAESRTFLSALPYHDYGWALTGKKLTIGGGSDETTLAAVDAFLAAMTPDDSVFYRSSSDHTVRAESTYPMADLQLGGRAISEFTILYGGNSGEQLWRSATALRDRIGALTGCILPLMSVKLAETLGFGEEIPAFLVGAEYGAARDEIAALDLGGASYRMVRSDTTTQIVFAGETFFTVNFAIDAFFDRLTADGAVSENERIVLRDAQYYTDDHQVREGDTPIGTLLIAGNDISLYRIVYGADDSARSADAAASLAAYLGRAVGMNFEVVSDASPETPYEIVVGITNRDTEEVVSRRAALENDGVLYYADGSRLYLTSHTSSGQYYAVFHFLEEKIGWRFYSIYDQRGDEQIQPCERIEIPADLDESHSSPFFYRNTSWGTTGTYQRKLGINASADPMYAIVGHAHTFEKLAGVPQTEQPCLSDENVYQTVLRNLRATIEANPTARVFSVTQNDNEYYCTCEKCSALAEAENQSGVMLTFVNRLADDIREDYPDVTLLTFAYTYTREPPKTIHTRDNVMIWLCSIECCFSHPLTDPDCPENAAFCRDILEWQKYTDRVYIWDYTTNYSYYCAPFPDLFTLHENIQFYLDHNVTGIYEQGNSATAENGEFSHLRPYLIGHLLWDPTMSEEEYDALIDNYLMNYYGRGWKYIRFYIDLTTQIAAGNHMYIFEFLPENYIGNSGVSYDYLLSLWEKAIELSENDYFRQHCIDSSIQVRVLMQDQYTDVELNRLMRAAGIPYIMQNVKVPDLG